MDLGIWGHTTGGSIKVESNFAQSGHEDRHDGSRVADNGAVKVKFGASAWVGKDTNALLGLHVSSPPPVPTVYFLFGVLLGSCLLYLLCPEFQNLLLM